LNVSLAGLKVSTFVHKVENPATWSLTFVGQKEICPMIWKWCGN